MADYNLLQSETGPAATVGDTTAVTVGMEIYTTAPAWVTHVHWWQAASDASTASRTVGIFETAGSSTALVSKVSASSGTGWQSVALDTPLAVTTSTRYIVAVYHPGGQYSSTSNYFDTGAGATGLVSGILNAPNKNDASLGYGQGVFAEGGALTKPNLQFNASNYWVDVTVTDANPTGLTVNAGSDQTILAGGTVNLIGTSSGATGTPTYAWTKTSGPAGTFGSASTLSTTFNPSGGAGTYVLRLTATDSNGPVFDEMIVTVTTAGLTASPVAVTATGWTVVGSSAVAALSDTDNGTYVQATGPSNLLLDTTLGPIQAPTSGRAWTCRVTAQKLTATSGTIVAKLYNGSTLISTAPSVAIPDSLGDVDCVFPAAEVSSMPSGTWASGVRVTLTVTAA